MSISVAKCSLVMFSEVLQCNDGTSNKVSNIIRRHIDNRKLLLICICYYHILSYSLGSFFLSIYGCIPVYYCNLGIFIVRVYVFLLLSMYCYCSSMYVFLSLSMYTYCCLCILRRGYPD
jgi:hypothetical protein